MQQKQDLHLKDGIHQEQEEQESWSRRCYIHNRIKTLFAQWNETEYTLTVNPNGGV